MILGVNEETIIKDYMSSNEYRKDANEKIINMYIDYIKSEEAINVFRDIMGVSEDLILESLKAIKEKYGNYNEYLLKEFNLNNEEIEKIRENYLI